MCHGILLRNSMCLPRITPYMIKGRARTKEMSASTKITIIAGIIAKRKHIVRTMGATLGQLYSVFISPRLDISSDGRSRMHIKEHRAGSFP